MPSLLRFLISLNEKCSPNKVKGCHSANLTKFVILTLSLAAIKKSIEWRLQVQIAFLTEVDLAPSRPE
jgi:hypothetical protein